jgi:hypothetical protein
VRVGLRGQFEGEIVPGVARPLLREEVIEGSYSRELVVFDVEDRVQLGDVKNVVDFLSQVEQFQFAACVTDGREAADELSHSRAIDIVHTGEVENNLFLAVGDKVANGVAEITDFFAQNDAAVNVEDGDVSDFASIYL